MAKDRFQVSLPPAFRIIVRVERRREPLRLHLLQKFSHSRAKGTLQIVGRVMKVACVRQIVEIEVIPLEFGDCSSVGENVPPRSVVQDDCNSRGRGVRNLADSGNVDATLRKPVERDLTERILSNSRLESHPTSQGREIMSKNRSEEHTSELQSRRDLV